MSVPKPGIPDFSSIVFSDEGDILSGMEDADLAYNQLIRPREESSGFALCSQPQCFALERPAIISYDFVYH